MEAAKKPRRPASHYWRWVVVLLMAIIIAIWMGFTPEGVLGKADAVGYAVCHRIDARSFHISDRQLPLCARCTGQYLGAMTGLAYQAIIGRRRTGTPPFRVIAVLVILAVAYGVDGLNSYLHLPPLQEAFPNLPVLYEPSNALRVLTGTGMGLAMAAALYPAFNSTLYRQADPRPALPGSLSILGMCASALTVAGLSLTHSNIVLYPLALISSAGVLVLLGMVYSMVLLMIFRLDNRYERLSQAIFPLLAGVAVAILQIAVFDFGRYILTGTWGEFPFG